MTELVSLPDSKIAAASLETVSSQPESTTLRNAVRESLRQYFIRLENTPPTNLYELVLAEVEIPILEMVLKHTGQNQSQAARILAMSRGTLRKKMQQYGMLNKKEKIKGKRIHTA